MSPRPRRPIRPLTIYGFRRPRPRRSRFLLLLLVLATLTVLTRDYGPIACWLMGASAGKVSAQRPSEPPALEPRSAFAAEPVTPAKEASVPKESVVEIPKPTPAQPVLRAIEPKPKRVSEPAPERKDSERIQSKGPASRESAKPLPIRQPPERREGRLVPAPQ